MKIFRIIAVASVFVWSTSSCEKYLDVNDDPNKTEFASLDVVLPAAQASTCIHVGGELFNLGGFWAQYHTQSPDAGQYQDIDAYNVSVDFFDRTWQELYAGALNDYKYIRENADGTNNAYYLVATLMEAYTYQVLVDLYGQVPYSEALQGTANLTPAYDEGQAIYKDLLSRIDEAMARYSADPANGEAPSGNDIIFGGNMSRWIQFGNTLKLKMLLRVYRVGDIFDQAEVIALANGGNLLSVNAQMTLFEEAANKSNPFYDVNYDRLGGVNHAASQTIVSFYQANNDPRLDTLYEPGSGGAYTTKPQGDFANRDISFDALAEPIVFELKPIVLFSAAEADFLRAEALERFGGGGQTAYEEGITASFAMYGIADTVADDYYGAGGPYEWIAGGTTEDHIKQIATQKWAAMANSQNLEAFFEINRLGYPEYKTLANAQPGDLVYSLASVLPPGQTPQRLLFADVSKSRNPNVPAQSSGDVAVPIWWAQ